MAIGRSTRGTDGCAWPTCDSSARSRGRSPSSGLLVARVAGCPTRFSEEVLRKDPHARCRENRDRKIFTLVDCGLPALCSSIRLLSATRAHSPYESFRTRWRALYGFFYASRIALFPPPPPRRTHRPGPTARTRTAARRPRARRQLGAISANSLNSSASTGTVGIRGTGTSPRTGTSIHGADDPEPSSFSPRADPAAPAAAREFGGDWRLPVRFRLTRGGGERREGSSAVGTGGRAAPMAPPPPVVPRRD